MAYRVESIASLRKELIIKKIGILQDRCDNLLRHDKCLIPNNDFSYILYVISSFYVTIEFVEYAIGKKISKS